MLAGMDEPVEGGDEDCLVRRVGTLPMVAFTHPTTGMVTLDATLSSSLATTVTPRMNAFARMFAVIDRRG